MNYICTVCGKLCESRFPLHACIDEEFQVSPTKKYMFTDDSGWNIYNKRGGDWEIEIKVTIAEAISEYRKVQRAE